MAEYTKHLMILLTPEQHAILKRHAYEGEVSMGEFVRQALTPWLHDDNGNGHTPTPDTTAEPQA
jgi:predicted HicB family RNase H-like nuclease